MKRTEEAVLSVAEITADDAAMNDAALASDFDEARFRARLVAAKADSAGYADLALAAAYVVAKLGDLGEVPRDGYAAGMLRVADELGVIGFDPL